MRICFVGDSFVNGTGDHQYLGWPGRLCVDARRRVDSLEGSEPWRRETTEGDGIHPGEGGYALIHRAVSTWPAWIDWFR